MSTQPDSPTAVVTAYLSAAVEGDGKAMRRLQQRSYPGRAGGTLRQFLLAFEVDHADTVSEVMTDVFVRLALAPRTELGPRLFRLRCVCEDRQGHPTPEGTWGVNPASLKAVKQGEAA